MDIVINIEKKNAFIILGAFLLMILAAGVAYATYESPSTGTGHNITDFGPGVLNGDMNITGTITVKGDVIIGGLPETAPYKNLHHIKQVIQQRDIYFEGVLCELNSTFCFMRR